MTKREKEKSACFHRRRGAERCPRRRIFPAAGVALAGIFFFLLFAAGSLAQNPGEPKASDSVGVEYYLGAGDKLKVTVFGQPDISGEFDIDGAGYISLPLLGQVKAADHTARDLQTQIEHELDAKFIIDPRVSIEVRNFRPFFILGQVTKPGSYPYQSGIDIRQAIAIGGGFTRRAQTDVVTLIRRTGAGKTRYDATLDVPVLPGDTIEVERRLF